MERQQPAKRSAIGRLLKGFRQAAGLSQEALAERAGVSWRTISDLERGVKQNPRPSTLRMLADAMALRDDERATLQAVAFPPEEEAAPSAAPSAGSTAAVLTNLPHALTSFVGREREMAAVRRLLYETRLLTLTGAGGCGKSRLALEVAERAAQANLYADGIWLVTLAPLSDGGLLVSTVATVLGVRERTGQPLLETLISFLRTRHMLILLDNCEHLLAACAELADALLRVCPRLTLLATSREALGILGERPWRVPSLRVVDARATRQPYPTEPGEAVALFVQRAAVARPAFGATAPEMEVIAQICRRLDGLPLAIELAAARLSTLSLEQLAARLSDRFRLLTGGSRTAMPHQQTLKATLDWSYDLLSEPERVLLHRLTVFAGSWTLEAAEVVCAGDGITSGEVLDLLAGLVAKSLAVLDDGSAGARYRFLETVRQYGGEKLLAAQEEAVVRDRHLEWCVILADEAAQRIGGAEREIWLARLEAELENLRSALHWSSRQAGRHEIGLRLAVSLEDFWYMRGYAGEGQRWLEELLASADTASTALRARALSVVALLTYYHGDYDRALSYFEEAYALHTREGNVESATWMLNYQGLIALLLGEVERAQTLLERVLPAHREQGDRHGVGWALSYLATIQRLQGNAGRASALYEESLNVFRDLGDKFGIGHQLFNLANVAWELGDLQSAVQLFRESLAARRSLLDRPGIADCLERLAATCADTQPERAAQLFGAAHSLREGIGIPAETRNRLIREHAVAVIHAALGEDAFAAAWAEGQTQSLESAIALALNETPPAES